jgi:hypothetical protein
MFEELDWDYMNPQDYFFYMQLMKEAEEMEELKKIQDEEEN